MDSFRYHWTSGSHVYRYVLPLSAPGRKFLRRCYRDRRRTCSRFEARCDFHLAMLLVNIEAQAQP